MSVWRDTIRKEIKSGGALSPCPRCGTPRVKRSEYIRCCGCAINWEEGEPLDQDPRSYRQQKMIEESKTSTGKPKREDENGRR
jgi:hypothetical protein